MKEVELNSAPSNLLLSEMCSDVLSVITNILPVTELITIKVNVCESNKIFTNSGKGTEFSGFGVPKHIALNEFFVA